MTVARTLDSRDILAVWEQGQRGSPARRPLLVLAAAGVDADWQELLEMPLGRRQRLLLEVRDATVGPMAELFIECPGCAGQLEYDLDTAERRPEPTGEAAAEVFEVEVDELVLELRLPNTADLVAIEGMWDADAARRLLFERCLLSARRRGDMVQPDALGAEVVEAAAEAMAEHDPGAEMVLDLACPLCGHQWKDSFDVAAHFWREIDVQARRLLREIDCLARAYGWTEGQILALSGFRRRCYMELIAS